MSESSTIEVNGGQLQDFTIDQFAGALALTLGSVGGLLMIIWKSRCMCKMNCCYLFQCERRPPQENEKDSDEEQPAPAVIAPEGAEPVVVPAPERIALVPENNVD
tara:strand:- start:8622 stop:8936 length:315 start_codon:yes stop_codon:yes gene_type:complete